MIIANGDFQAGRRISRRVGASQWGSKDCHCLVAKK